MSVSDLIYALSNLPQHLPVKVLLSEIYGGHDDTGQFIDDKRIPLNSGDAIEADTVRHEGNHVLIVSK